ncbi:MAG: leucyl/phenylalanyl-tRNA--protein transferase, partial [Pseudomonadota bacterium]
MAHPPEKYSFPPLESASTEGLLAIGGDLDPERILSAYRQGIFPWYSAGQPILWWSPNPRAILYPQQVRISRSLRRSLRQRGFVITADRYFAGVIRQCTQPRNGQSGTWITPDM